MNEKALNDVRGTMVQNAIDCTFYIASSDHIAKELASTYNISYEEAKGLMSVAACRLVDKIKELK